MDTALDYGKECPGGKQSELGAAIVKAGVARSSVFITTKIRAGLDISHGGPLCIGASAAYALKQVQQDVAELNVTQVDLVLLHAPCLEASHNLLLWQGLEQALAMNLTRAIGVSNYKVKNLQALQAKAKTKPAVNQVREREEKRRRGVVEEMERRIGRDEWTRLLDPTACGACYINTRVLRGAT